MGERHMASNDEESIVEGSELGSVQSGDRSPRPDGAGSEPASSETAEDRIFGAISAGDHRAALLLCAREHAAAIGRLCMAMIGVQAEAEDLTQETLLAAHAGFGGFQRSGSVRSWLFGIARRKCARHLEQRRAHDQKFRSAPGPDRSPEPDELVARRKQAEQARAALAEVRPSEREALLLRYAADLSFREVGEACGIDEAAARKRVSRALARLRAALSSEGSR
jgi:RNA polymerase sigma-70 factor (ECF subfamily)